MTPTILTFLSFSGLEPIILGGNYWNLSLTFMTHIFWLMVAMGTMFVQLSTNKMHETKCRNEKKHGPFRILLLEQYESLQVSVPREWKLDTVQ